jgi:hypothetical protein
LCRRSNQRRASLKWKKYGGARRSTAPRRRSPKHSSRWGSQNSTAGRCRELAFFYVAVIVSSTNIHPTPEAPRCSSPLTTCSTSQHYADKRSGRNRLIVTPVQCRHSCVMTSTIFSDPYVLNQEGSGRSYVLAARRRWMRMWLLQMIYRPRFDMIGTCRRSVLRAAGLGDTPPT